MSFFNKKDEQINSSSRLKQLSSDALNTFHKVLADLRSINEASSVRQEELQIEVNVLNLEIKELGIINDNNAKVIGNIEKILS